MTAPGALRYDSYFVDGQAEWLMRIGPDDGPALLFIPPLFEEMNRTRALLAATMRDLATRGFGCWLPDLPGTGESERPLATCGWDDWTAAMRAVAELVKPRLIASFRGGALLDGGLGAEVWRLSPATGASLLRDLSRSGLVTGEAHAGYELSEALASGLTSAIFEDEKTCRTVRLSGDAKPADARLDGPALWRRSEPGDSPELAVAIAADIAAWVKRCDTC